MERTADVVIIGGGVMGTSIALHLARRKAGRILLCERKFIGSGPTGRSSAVLRRHYTLELYARMATRSLEIYQHFEELTGTPAGIAVCGMLHIVGPDDLPALKTTVAMLKRIGADADALDPDGLRALLPRLNAEGLAGGAFDPTAGYADPVAVTAGYASKARELGVAVHQTTTVTGLKIRGGRTGGVLTDQGVVATPIVVNAAGVWAGHIAKLAGIELPITPSRIQLATFKIPPDFGQLPPVIGDNIQHCYFRPEGRDLLMVGTRGQPGAHPFVDPDACEERIGQEYAVKASKVLCHRFPAMEQGEATGGYASMYDMTPDAHFILEEAPEIPGLFTVAGFSGHGFKHSPVVGRIMADLICDGRTTEFDIAPFSSRRFTDGRPPWRGLYAGVPY